MQTEAYAKLNLTLDVLGRRGDGYHDLSSVMQTVTLCDGISYEPGGGALEAVSNWPHIPAGDKNLAVRAALAFSERTGTALGGRIEIFKRIPAEAGLGGGSCDAAAVLLMLNEYFGRPLTEPELLAAGADIGSDVPYALLRGTALAEGRGERLTRLRPLPHCWFVICKPEFSISTAELFRAVDGTRLRARPDTEGMLRAVAEGDLRGVGRRICNVFEQALDARRGGEIMGIKAELIDSGACGAAMTGTGSAVFGMFTDGETAGRARERLSKKYRDVFYAETL